MWSINAVGLAGLMKDLSGEAPRLVKACTDALSILWVVMGILAFMAAFAAWTLMEEISLDRASFGTATPNQQESWQNFWNVHYAFMIRKFESKLPAM